MKNDIREFLDNCARFSNAHTCNNLDATALEVDTETWAEFDVHVHEAETTADNIDALVKAARGITAATHPTTRCPVPVQLCDPLAQLILALIPFQAQCDA